MRGTRVRGHGRRRLWMGPVTLLAAMFVLGAGAGVAQADVAVSISPDQTAPFTFSSVTFTAIASGSCGEPSGPTYVYTFFVDGNPVQGPSPSNTFTTSFSTTGGHTVTVGALDLAAGQCMTAGAQASTTVDVVLPLSEGSPSPNPSGAVNEGASVTFTAPDPTGGKPPFTYDWSFSGPTGPFTDAHGQQISRQFLSAGSQTTYVRVTDSASPAHTTVAQVTTMVNPAPPQGGDIIQSPAGQVDAGTTVTFTAAPNGGVPPYTYAWSFTCKEAPGGLHDATGPTITRTFTTPGVYNTCVQITDSAQPPTLASFGAPYIFSIQTVVVAPTFNGGSSSCSAGQVSSVEFQLTHVTGCLTKQADGSYMATSAVRVNGVPIAPAQNSPLVIKPPSTAHPGGQIGVGLAQIALGGVVLFQGSVNVDLPAGGVGQEKAFATESVKPVSLFGLKLGGSFTINLGRDGSGAYFSTFTLTVNLPSVLQNSTGTGGVTGSGSIRVEDDGAVDFNGAHIQASNAQIGPIVVKNVCFSLIPGGSNDVSSCPVPPLPESATGNSAFVSCAANPAAGDHWDATAVIDLPTPQKTELSVFGGGVGSTITDLGGFATGLNIPIVADDVFLRTIGAGFCFTQPLTIRGDLGAGFFPVPGRGDTVDINGTLIFTNSNPWSLALDGTIAVFGQQVGSGGVTLYSNGNFDFKASVNFTLAGFLGLNGGVSGWVEPTNRLFDVEGNVNVCIGSACLGANGVVSSTGVAGCINIAGIGAGAGYTWATKALNVMGPSCSVGAFQATKAAVDAAGGARLVRVAPGTRGVALRLGGANGPPKVHITGPGGTDISSPAHGGIARGRDWLVIEDPNHHTTNVLLAHPRAGTYKITATDPSNGLTSVERAPVLAPFSGHGHVSSVAGGRRRLQLSYVLPAGAKLSLVERGRHVERTLVPSVHGHACGGARHTVAGGEALCFTTTFRPSLGAGGSRRIVAVVQRNGIPAAVVTVAHYAAPALRLPARPAKVQLRRHGSTVTIAWTRSAGAARYAVSARTGDGRSLSFTPGAVCRAVQVPGVAGGTTVTAIVEGVRFDAVRGHPAKVGLKKGKSSAGASGRLRGRTC